MRVDARVIVNPAHTAGLRLVATLRDSSGNKLRRARSMLLAGNSSGRNCRCRVSQGAAYTISVQLVGKSGSAIDSGETDVYVHSAAESVVTIQKNGFLACRRRAEFPVGMYSCSHYDEMAAARFQRDAQLFHHAWRCGRSNQC